MRWQMRPFAPAADREYVEGLWQAAMPPAWPPLADGIAQLSQGLVAEAGTGPVGFVALDVAGSIPLILVAPEYQRRGIGTALLAAALDRVRGGGATGVTAGSGGGSYIWPGVPLDLPGAVRFFTARRWQRSHDTLDLVTDLRRYRPPPGAYEDAASKGVTITQPAGADLADVLAFEAATFPNWSHWFAVASPPGILVARASEMLREAGARNCHIGWTTRESFYRHAGYQPWRRYAMLSGPAQPLRCTSSGAGRIEPDDRRGRASSG